MTHHPHRGTYLQPGSLLDENPGSTLSGNQHVVAEQLTKASKKLGRQLSSAETTKLSTAISTAIANERARAKSIRGCPEAASRPHMAEHLADNTEMSVEEAKALLAIAPLESQRSEPTPFGQFMDRDMHPGVGANFAIGTGDDDDDDRAGERTRALAQRLGLKGFARRD